MKQVSVGTAAVMCYGVCPQVWPRTILPSAYSVKVEMHFLMVEPSWWDFCFAHNYTVRE